MPEAPEQVPPETPIQEQTQTPAPKRYGWNVRTFLIVFTLTLVLQMFALPCLCGQGTFKLNLGLWLDLVVFLRVVWGIGRHQSDRGWQFYAILLLTSPIWINLLTSFLTKGQC